jgi:hypothetical protein
VRISLPRSRDHPEQPDTLSIDSAIRADLSRLCCVQPHSLLERVTLCSVNQHR